MASSLLTVAKPFLHFPPSQVPSPRIPPCSSPLSRWKLDVRRRSLLRVSSMTQTWEPSKVVPQADLVLIRLEELPEKSAGGVLLPKSAVKFERYLTGEILSVGADVADLDAGKKVLFSDMNAYDVELASDARHCFCKASDLLAVVE
ncbi:10 kDa chaperonin 1, chloroplastic-like [Phalaenopsis equestris]|uniref:10 kDa chaperonin 1, chloroplastic-like n=1 Tax=Phalaenopsis equestris TaxID=78828 RepID=UPI0009E5E178|nr:10 kDa chaperonin 1, chloroplastic-like [Phalaenopsis equestris]